MFKSLSFARPRILAHLDTYGLLYTLAILEPSLIYGYWNLFH